MAHLRNSENFVRVDRKCFTGDREVMLNREARRGSRNNEQVPGEVGSVWILI